MTTISRGKAAPLPFVGAEGLFDAPQTPAGRTNQPAKPAPIEPAAPGSLARGDEVAVTITYTGEITSVQYAGCEHATSTRRNGVMVHSTTHGTRPCPDRDTVTGIMLVEKVGDVLRRSWIYLRVPGRTVTINRLGGAR